jgi:hypothetical protein
MVVSPGRAVGSVLFLGSGMINPVYRLAQTSSCPAPGVDDDYTGRRKWKHTGGGNEADIYHSHPGPVLAGSRSSQAPQTRTTGSTTTWRRPRLDTWLLFILGSGLPRNDLSFVCLMFSQTSERHWTVVAENSCRVTQVWPRAANVADSQNRQLSKASTDARRCLGRSQGATSASSERHRLGKIRTGGGWLADDS